jgi:hypothetical protein
VFEVRHNDPLEGMVGHVGLTPSQIPKCAADKITIKKTVPSGHDCSRSPVYHSITTPCLSSPEPREWRRRGPELLSVGLKSHCDSSFLCIMRVLLKKAKKSIVSKFRTSPYVPGKEGFRSHFCFLNHYNLQRVCVSCIRTVTPGDVKGWAQRAHLASLLSCTVRALPETQKKAEYGSSRQKAHRESNGGDLQREASDAHLASLLLCVVRVLPKK